MWVVRQISLELAPPHSLAGSTFVWVVPIALATPWIAARTILSTFIEVAGTTGLAFGQVFRRTPGNVFHPKLRPQAIYYILPFGVSSRHGAA
jgi:hypothetical protein